VALVSVNKILTFLSIVEIGAESRLFIHKKLRNMYSSPTSRSFFANLISKTTKLLEFLIFGFSKYMATWQHISHDIFKRKMIIFGKNKFFLQAIKSKFLALEQQKRKKDLKSVFHFSKHDFTSQARRRIELPFCV
jgi:predicted patatin/cPLA2 family phospholipase